MAAPLVSGAAARLIATLKATGTAAPAPADIEESLLRGSAFYSHLTRAVRCGAHLDYVELADEMRSLTTSGH